MANILLPKEFTKEEILLQMQEDSRYEIADNEAGCVQEYLAANAPFIPKAVKVPKVFLSNDCVFNCSYCACRESLCHRHHYSHQPKEFAQEALRQAMECPSKGVFMTSAIYKNPDYTQELLVESLRILREELKFSGFVHAKIMPGCDPELIEQAGWYADRLSVNIELPHSSGYSVIAKQKNKSNILTPMGEIAKRVRGYAGQRNSKGRKFAKSGQTTQMIVGAMFEDDRTVLTLSEALYHKYGLRRVYYSGFGQPSTKFEFFPEENTPKWRIRRLYQADRLMELYGFKAGELVDGHSPDMQYDVDPKTDWALRHLNLYPVELEKADYETLIRVPGIGIANAKKIILARRQTPLNFDLLKKLRISMKRAKYFVTCGGKYIGGTALDSPFLRRIVSDTVPRQISIFDQESTEPRRLIV